MELTDLYKKGETLLRQREIGSSLDGVETGFVMRHDRVILDRYTFRQRCIDAVEADTRSHILGIDLGTPVIMSAMTNPIHRILKNGLLEVAHALRESESLMWTGSPLPENLKEIIDTGVPVACNIKPFKDRKKMFRRIEKIQEMGVRWVGIEIDVGQGTKIGDTMRADYCAPLSLKELTEIRKRVSVPLIFKGVLSDIDAMKSVDAGADGIVVSSHGGHTLDYLPHALQVMDEIIIAVKGKILLIVDGGFRRGSDVLKGLAFGATLVGLGRPILYGLAAGGREGVRGIIDGITHELKRLMSMVGASTPGQVQRNMVIRD